MFSKEPSLFETYHQGFRRQTLKWPANPVDVILKLLKKHPKWQIADLGAARRPALMLHPPAPLCLALHPATLLASSPPRLLATRARASVGGERHVLGR